MNENVKTNDENPLSQVNLDHVSQEHKLAFVKLLEANQNFFA